VTPDGPLPRNPRQDLVNRAGYALQLAIEHEIRAECDPMKKWDILATEMPYGEGFLDIVAGKSSVVAMIECKRSLDSEWIFLVAKGTSGNEALCRLEWRDEKAQLRCSSFNFAVGSHVSGFCVVDKGKNRADLLESVCQDLLNAIYSVARQPLLLQSGGAVYLPIVVTTAPLVICEFDPAEVPLKDATLPPSAQFSEVNFLRYQKSLAFGDAFRVPAPMRLPEIARHLLRTVLICHASHLRELLGLLAWHLNPKPLDDRV
jgi:hypothetical protein